jgi:PAS domain S-box-containing protein/diguanylate cyclase (GGDEF)-like protein
MSIHDRIAQLAASATIAICAFVMIGWWMDVAWLAQAEAHRQPMPMSAALSLLLCGLATIWLPARPGLRALTALVPVFLVAGVAFAATMNRFDLGIEQFIFGRGNTNEGATESWITISSFAPILLGASVLTWAALARNAIESQLGLFFGGLFIALMGALLAGGYAFAALGTSAWAAAVHISLPASIGLIFFGVALIATGFPGFRALYYPAQLSAVAIALLTVTVALSLWWGAFAQQQTHLRQTVSGDLTHLAELIKGRAQERARTFQRAAQRLASRDPSIQEAEFALESESLVDAVPGLIAVGWVERDGRLRWLAGPGQHRSIIGQQFNSEPTRHLLLEQTAQDRKVRLSAPAELRFRGAGAVLAAPIETDGEVTGFIIAGLPYQTFLGALVSSSARGYSLTIGDGNAAVFNRVLAPEQADGAAQSKTLTLLGRPWTLTISPSPQLIADRTSALPQITLLAGLIGGFLLSLAAGLIFFARARTQAAKEASRALLVTETRSRSIVQSALDGIVTIDHTGRITEFNPAATRMFGWSREEALGQVLSELVIPEHLRQRHERGLHRYLQPDAADSDVLDTRLELTALHRDGREFPVELVVTRVSDSEPPEFGGFIHDLTERTRAEADLRLSRRALDASSSGIIICDATAPDMPVVYANHAFAQMTGYEIDRILGTNCRFLQASDRGQPALDPLRKAIREGKPCQVELRNYRANGEMFWNEVSIDPVRDERDRLTHFIGVQNDITRRKQEQDRLDYEISHDALTGLPNLHAANEMIQGWLDKVAGTGNQIGVVLINIDRLHHINDTLGRDIGDQLLIEVAIQLSRLAAFTGCFAARIAGDEFILVAAPGGDQATLTTLAGQAVERLDRFWQIEGRSIYVTCCVGISTAGNTADSPTRLLAEADLAMNQAKRLGRGRIQVYSDCLAKAASDRLVLATHLREGLKGNQFHLHYQPLIDVTRGAINGFEALLRWSSPALGPVSPDRFIPVSEDTGMILQIGQHALKAAVQQIRALINAGFDPVPVSVNVSLLQLQRPEFPGEVRRALEGARLPTDLLKLEITESLLMQGEQSVLDTLHELREMGVRISLDDFGTGYSSLAHLRELPLDEIKIDRMFVKDVPNDPFASTLCRAIVKLSRELGLSVVAEGVETAEQAKFLHDAGCQVVQGYLFSRPLPADAIATLLAPECRWQLDGTCAVPSQSSTTTS